MAKAVRTTQLLSDGPLAEYEAKFPGIRTAFLEAVTGLPDQSNDDDIPSSDPRILLSRSARTPTAFDYQIELADQCLAVFRASRGSRTALLTLPTGAGKTRTALLALLRLVYEEPLSVVLWLAPSRELLDQATRSLVSLWEQHGLAPDIECVRCDRVKQLSSRDCAQVLFATPQLLASWSKRNRPLPKADVVVFDEAHQVEAPTFRDALERLRRASPGQLSVVGLSATPGRPSAAETEQLSDFFGGNLLRSRLLEPNAIRKLQRRGILARVRFELLKAPAESQRLAELAVDSGRFRKTIDVIRRRPEGRWLVFAASIAHAHAIDTVLRRFELRSAVISSRTPPEERERTLRRFANDDLSIVINKSVLATGYDCPGIRYALLTVPIRSSLLFEQIVGRVSRGPRIGGCSRPIVYQFEDHLAMHGYPSSYYRYEDFDWRSDG